MVTLDLRLRLDRQRRLAMTVQDPGVNDILGALRTRVSPVPSRTSGASPTA